MLSFTKAADAGRSQNHIGRHVRALILPATIAAASIMAAGCAPFYTPNPIQAPLVEGSGEIHAAAYYGTANLSGNAAVSVTNHLVLTGAYSFDPEPKEPPSHNSTEHVSHRFWEVGAGWSYPITPELRVEILGGFGKGHAVATTDDSLDVLPGGIYISEGDYRRVSAQATLVLEPKFFKVRSVSREGETVSVSGLQIAHAGIALRASYVWFDALERDRLATIRPRALFLEPVMVSRGGWRNLQTEMQLGVSIKALSSGGSFRSQWLIVNIGAHLMLDGLW
jgi:hypothetical protein